MVIENLNQKLPVKESALDKIFLNCTKLKKLIPDTSEHYIKRFEKAKHDLSRAIAEFQDKCWDWTVVKSYYAIHHAGNAILSKKRGFFSKDHLCLIVALHHYKLIDKTLFSEISNLHEKFSDTFGFDFAFQLRKISQYSVDEWKNINETDAKIMLDIAVKFVSYIEKIL